jgi:hypothetical protein
MLAGSAAHQGRGAKQKWQVVSACHFDLFCAFLANAPQNRPFTVDAEAVILQDMGDQLAAHGALQMDQPSAVGAFEVQMLTAIGIVAHVLKGGRALLVFAELAKHALLAKSVQKAVERAFAHA